MIVSFHNQGTEDVFNGRSTRAARQVCPQNLWRIAARKLDQLNAAVTLASLSQPPGNKLKALKDDRRGQYAIRINDQYRVCFRWSDAGPADVEITDYH